MSMFQKATKQQGRLRLGLCGPSGSGKTYTALALATRLGDKVALVDTEHGSASLYADEFNFDVLEMHAPYSPEKYVRALKAAEEEGYGVIVLDSISHAWAGEGGVLQIVDDVSARSKSHNKFDAWREGTPAHNSLVNAILGSKAHVIATMRSKTEYVQEKDERGKTTVRKVGMAPVQRDGMEYEFTLVGDLDAEHTLVVTKSRCRALADAVIRRPGEDMAKTLRDWLHTGAPESATPRTAPEGAEKAKGGRSQAAADAEAMTSGTGGGNNGPASAAEGSERLATPEHRKELSERLASLDPEMRELVAAEWDRTVGCSFKAAERFTEAHARAAAELVKDVERATYLRRQKRANAVMGEVSVTSDDGRHALVKEATGGETESTGRLTDAQIAAVVDYCEALKRQDEGVPA